MQVKQCEAAQSFACYNFGESNALMEQTRSLAVNATDLVSVELCDVSLCRAGRDVSVARRGQTPVIDRQDGPRTTGAPAWA